MERVEVTKAGAVHGAPPPGWKCSACHGEQGRDFNHSQTRGCRGKTAALKCTNRVCDYCGRGAVIPRKECQDCKDRRDEDDDSDEGDGDDEGDTPDEEEDNGEGGLDEEQRTELEWEIGALTENLNSSREACSELESEVRFQARQLSEMQIAAAAHDVWACKLKRQLKESRNLLRTLEEEARARAEGHKQAQATLATREEETRALAEELKRAQATITTK